MRPSGESAPTEFDAAEAFAGKVVEDLAASLSSLLVCLGDTLGLYRSLAASGPVTPAELAGSTGLSEAYVSDWLLNQAASGYLSFDATSGALRAAPGARGGARGRAQRALPRPGVPCGACAGARAPGGVRCGLRPTRFALVQRQRWRAIPLSGTVAHLVGDWIPALTGVREKLIEGATVAEVGCGVGTATIAMAKAYPQTQFWGFDAELVQHPLCTALRRRRRRGRAHDLRGAGRPSSSPTMAICADRGAVQLVPLR